MIVTVNHKELELIDSSYLKDVLMVLELPEQGIALAVDNEVIPKTNWAHFRLQEQMKITLIRATQGG